MADKDPHWIEHAHLDKGALRRETHTAAGRDISDKRLHAAAHSKNDTIRRQAELAETLKHIHKMTVIVAEEIEDHAPGRILGVFATDYAFVRWIAKSYPALVDTGSGYWADRNDPHGTVIQIHELEITQ